MSFHKDLLVGDIHIPYNWKYANAAARTGAIGFVSTDVGKLARQEDDESLWMLTATTPTWILIGGGSGAINFDRVVTVSPDGSAEYTSIQDAIDAIAGPGPTITAPWIVFVGPGEYTENVIGLPYVSIVGLGTKNDGARLLGTYTFPATKCSIENLKIIATPGDGNFAVDCTANGEYKINNCELAGRATVGNASGVLEVGGGSTDLELDDVLISYTATGTAGGVKSHYGIKFSGTNTFRMSGTCRIEMFVEDIDDEIYLVYEDAISMIAYVQRNHFFVANTGANSLVSFWKMQGTGKRYIQGNNLSYISSGAPGAEKVYDLSGGASLYVYSSHNRFETIGSGVSPYVTFAGAEVFNGYFDDLAGFTVTPPGAPASMRYIVSQDYGSVGSTMRTDGPIFIDNPPSAKAFDAFGANVFLAGVPLVVVLDSELWDTEPSGTGLYNPATGIFTIPVDGDYAFKGALTFDMAAVAPAAAADILIEILVGVVVAWSFYDEHVQPAGLPHGPEHSVPICTEMPLVATDLVTIRVTVGVNGSVMGSPAGALSNLVVRKVR